MRDATVVRAVLNELGMDGRIDTLAARKLIQKTIFMAQDSGLELGFRFSWDSLGPYSPALAKTYPYLDEQGPSLSERAASRLVDLKKVISLRPEALPLDDWLELTSSIRFLEEKGDDAVAIDERILSEKSHVVGYLAVAREALRPVQ
jgi:hypothetical protein